jgi:hypothetical protein
MPLPTASVEETDACFIHQGPQRSPNRPITTGPYLLDPHPARYAGAPPAQANGQWVGPPPLAPTLDSPALNSAVAVDSSNAQPAT